MELHDKTVVVTGAGSGIGRALAAELVARGAQVALSDVDGDTLAETARHLASSGPVVFSEQVDVADRHAVERHAANVIDHFGRVDVVINNAGVSLTARVESMTYEDFEWVMNINFWGAVHGTKAFLSHLRDQGSGAIVNVSSAFGLFAAGSQSAYNASKFATRGFTEALALEVHGTGIVVCRVHPGGVATNIVRHSRLRDTALGDADRERLASQFERAVLVSAPKAARVIANGIEKEKPRILIGADAYVLDAIARAFPTGYGGALRVVGRAAARLGRDSKRPGRAPQPAAGGQP
jgi:NAD(P)-dependent dehydrogenase (short-subunit alcohol dehydrogenase family)